jgi:uncharacterized RDD family membrane protein YckC
MGYPNLLRRYVASLIDLITVFFLVYLYSRTPLYTPRGNIGPFMFFVIFLSYEPLLTVFACTPGQASMRFRVRKPEDLRRIALGQAYLRLLVKYALGFISFLTMPARRDRRSIHDLAAGTIVVEASAAK